MPPPRQALPPWSSESYLDDHSPLSAVSCPLTGITCPCLAHDNTLLLRLIGQHPSHFPGSSSPTVRQPPRSLYYATEGYWNYALSEDYYYVHLIPTGPGPILRPSSIVVLASKPVFGLISHQGKEADVIGHKEMMWKFGKVKIDDGALKHGGADDEEPAVEDPAFGTAREAHFDKKMRVLQWAQRQGWPGAEGPPVPKGAARPTGYGECQDSDLSEAAADQHKWDKEKLSA
ncbi:uncharacterized protein C8Q71DRAFT_906722 [Rhodofomes roseus]|uniref:Uncharacterized protein n=1 Tax=Rhodofomes roseus TaxID=34475 RepID=A0ABQ8KIU8_9APHY|nr:uncharacterized protein C8Q71DRAFT_906722 [Rhodofomes roseus]KAH9837760.1 hypothetical protein C8Q71DRAFT_906722 [Rhodofomes roseus]